MTEEKLTPMMEQYFEAKKKNPEAILFFRLGDFYEMFFEDAKIASGELNLTLTGRAGANDKTPMCGVPYMSVDGYIEKLVKKGYKVAIAEQIGDPKAKGLTKREVVRVVTPGTLMTEGGLNDAKNNYIALIIEEKDTIALAGGDISTGECFYGVYNGTERLMDALFSLEASEILIYGKCSFIEEIEDFIRLRQPNTALTSITATEDELTKEDFPNGEMPAEPIAKRAVGALLKYLRNTAGEFHHISHVYEIEGEKYLQLDTYTLRNLEITKNLRDGGKASTLFDALDSTKTPMGSRLLKQFLERPLLSIKRIADRLDATEEFFENFAMREDFFAAAKEIKDMERLLTRISFGSAKAREVLLLKNSLFALPKLKNAVEDAKSNLIKQAADGIGDFSALAKKIDDTVEDETSGRIVKDGVNEELDSYRKLAGDSKALLQEMEEKEREKTGIRALKIGYNRVFGYYIEVRNSGKDLIPEYYERKQTLANAERYSTKELKEFETKILGAEEKAAQLEEEVFAALIREIGENLTALQETAAAVAKIDVFAAFAETADRYRYVRPKLSVNGEIIVKDGRHPLVERLLKHEIFVPNDTKLNHAKNELLLITGPNMAGKSTYMRQVALIVIMAQAGSFVPAESAVITPVDRVFTRIGASDDLIGGESTFMVEMKEVSHIIANATSNSLIVLDEIGRGTSTYDGMSIARAVAEHISEKIHAKTLFATHYHELTSMEGNGIKNLCVAVKERDGEVAFIRRIVEGAADKSYGIHVGKLAGLPESVIKRAEIILKELEKEPKRIAEKKSALKEDKEKKSAENMGNLFVSGVLRDLTKLDCLSMTPLEAMNTLFKLQEQARKEMGIG
ncbi:MAG: DNA mismatch repair protein MutS [Selenomonadaceae bacterium]|nr:DNA mismatch repair protein MutS [Selenomonadaceae bacterium]